MSPILYHYSNFTHWHPGQPNGGAEAKLCAVADEQFQYWDEDCGQEQCFYCMVKDLRQFCEACAILVRYLGQTVCFQTGIAGEWQTYMERL